MTATQLLGRIVGTATFGLVVACATTAPPVPPPPAAPIDVRSYQQRFVWEIDASPRAYAIDPGGRFALASILAGEPSQATFARLTFLDLDDGTMSVLDLDIPFDLSTQAHALSVAPDGASFVAGWVGQVAVVNVPDRSIRATMDYVYDGNTRGNFNALEYGSDGEHIVGVSRDIVWWDARSGAHVRTLEGLAGATRIGMGERGILGIALNQFVEIRRAGDADALCRFEGRASSVKPSPDGVHVTAAFQGGALRTWRIADCAQVNEWSAETNFVQSIAWLPDGRHLVAGSADGVVRIWDAVTGTRIHALTAHGEGSTGVAVSADGRRLITISWGDRTIKLWEAGGRSGHYDDGKSTEDTVMEVKGSRYPTTH